MDFQALTEYTGWKSPNVFVKHYLKDFNALSYYAVAAGRIVPPSNTLPENDVDNPDEQLASD